MRNRLSLLGLALGIVLSGPGALLRAQDAPFSSGPEYQAMLAELARDHPRPSRMSVGGLLKQPLPTVPVEVKETAEGLQLENTLWRLEMRKSPWQMSLANKQTGIAWQLAASDGGPSGMWWTTGRETIRLARVEEVRREGNRWRIQGRVAGRAESIALDLEILTPEIIRLSLDAARLGEDAGLGLGFAGPGPFFGLGERFETAKLDGLRTTLRPEDMPGGAWRPGHNWTYIPVPLLYTPRGLGLYLDTAWPSTFDLTQAGDGKFSVQLRGGSTDCYFFVAQSPKGILRAYTHLMGRPPLPPPWAFGVWIDSRQGRGPVMSDAQRIRELGIPVSAIWVHDFMDHATNLGFPLWTSGYWDTEPARFTGDLHKLGFKVHAYRSPYVRSILAPYLLANPTFEVAARKGFLVLGKDGKPAGPTFEPVPLANIDFTNPAAVDWWEAMLRRSLAEYDFNGWMEDFGEWIEDDHRFAAGKDGRIMANLYPLFYHRLTYEIARRVKPDFVSFARSGAAGSQGSTCVIWGGDQLVSWARDHGLPSVVTAGITAGLSGFSTWGPDILSKGTSKEAWFRWLQFGALTPVTRDHVWEKGKFTVDLWFDSETTEMFRRYARLHVSLFPYFYTYAHEATRTGLPIIRHTMLEASDDPAAWDVEYQYLLGEKILVAPVIEEGARRRTLYLPRGRWVNYWTGEILEGGKQVEVPAPLDQIPLLVRAGSVIPLASEEIETLAQDLAGEKYRTHGKSLTWRVFSAGGAARETFEVYDGTRATAEQSVQEVKLTVGDSPTLRSYEVILAAGSKEPQVVLGGKRLEKLDDGGYRAGKQGWWRHPTDGTLRVKFLADNFVLRVQGI